MSSIKVNEVTPPLFIVSPSGAQYTAVSKLGAGSYGSTYKAECVTHGNMEVIPRSVAIKISHTATPSHPYYQFEAEQYAKNNKKTQVEEEKFLNQLKENQQSTILKIFEGFSVGDQRYTVCELLVADLSTYMKMNPGRVFSLDEMRILSRQLLEGLVSLASEGIIHCDLTPSNILLENAETLQIRIADFGVSILKRPGLRSSGVQSLCYRAPEVALGLPFDEKIDIWSLGCTLAKLFRKVLIFPCDFHWDTEQANQNILLAIAKRLGSFSPHIFDNSNFYKHISFLYELGLHKENRLCQFLFDTQEVANLNQDQKNFLDLLQQMLLIDPNERISPQDALKHPFFS